MRLRIMKQYKKPKKQKKKTLANSYFEQQTAINKITVKTNNESNCQEV